jgi:hypothetical protein
MSINFKKTTFFFLCFIVSIGLSAQINLKNKAKDLVKEKSETEKAKLNEQQETTPSAGKSEPAKSEPRSAPVAKPTGNTRDAAQTTRSKPGMGEKYKASDVELDFASEPFAPSIVWASLLSENSWYFNITNGQMKLNNIEVSFLPKKTTSGKEVKYESYNNVTPLLRMEVWDTKANVIKETMHYEAKPATAPFYDMEVLEGYDYKAYATLTEGSYELRFWAGTKHFYTFPFEVEKISNPDPYAPVHDFYFLKGPWQNWGRVEFGPDGHFIFNYYLTHQTTTVVNSAQWDAKRDYKFLVKLYRDGKMVAAHSLDNSGKGGFEEGDIQTRNGKWIKNDCTFHKYPVAKPGSRDFFMKADMKDGNYTAEVWLKSLEGVESTYKYGFTVKNGAVVPATEADRTLNTNPLQFLEQGPGRFYVKKI